MNFRVAKPLKHCKNKLFFQCFCVSEVIQKSMKKTLKNDTKNHKKINENHFQKTFQNNVPKISLKSCKKRALGPPRAPKWEPRSPPGDPRWVPKIIEKGSKIEVCSWDPLGIPKRHKNCTKIVPT